MSVDHAKAVGATSSDDYFVTISSDSWRWRCLHYIVCNIYGRQCVRSCVYTFVINTSGNFFAVTQIVRGWSYVTTSATRRSNRSMKILSFVSLHVGSVRNVQTIFGCIS